MRSRSQRPMWLNVLVGIGLLAVVGLSFYFRFDRIFGDDSKEQPFDDTTLTSVVMASADEGWALGNWLTRSFVLHYNGGRWQREPIDVEQLAGDYDAWLLSGKMVSASEGWFVGRRAIFHLQAGKWLTETIPVRKLNDVDVDATGKGWAVAADGSILRRNSEGTWSKLSSPTDKEITAVQMVGDEAWAVGGWDGNNGGRDGFILHYRNNQWRPFTETNTVPLNGISMVSADEGWAVGGTGGGYLGEKRSVLLHYKGGQWSPVDSPTDLQLNAVQMLSADEGWAVGGSHDRRTILHYTNGRWRVLYSQGRGQLLSLHMISPTEGWAVGENNAILHYRDGRWLEQSAASSATPTPLINIP